MGARPMARVIQNLLKKPLANDLLFGDLNKGGHVNVTVSEDNEIAVEVLSEAVKA
jgi:ATP-dependent Clp protease ATP-binding subunit ClpA